MLMMFATIGRCCAGSGGSKVRQACCAGSWYPGEPSALAEMVDGLLAQAPVPDVRDKPLAIIAPHAGYAYSAPVAAAAYRHLQGHKYKRVILLAFSHRLSGTYNGVDVPGEYTAYATPLGEVPVDRESCDLLLRSTAFASHPGCDRDEHSLELQLPFLQSVAGEFKIVPLHVGRMSTQDYARAAAAMLPLLDADTLLVASTDFTHYGAAFGYEPFRDDIPDNIRKLADNAAQVIENVDFDGFASHIDKTGDTICGRGPISLLMRIFSMKMGVRGLRTAHDTSGRMSGDWSSRCVTYQSFVFVPRESVLDEREQTELLKLARQTAVAFLNKADLPNVEIEKLPAGISQDGACFVTLERHGELRGCIGNMEATGPLYQSVMHNAISACQDRRFIHNPVTAPEIADIDIEISYLTPMQQISDVMKIVVGRDGLLISLGGRRGVLLPQVAAERGWTREEFLQATCRKASLPLDSWKRPEAMISVFTAEVFGERSRQTSGQ